MHFLLKKSLKNLIKLSQMLSMLRLQNGKLLLRLGEMLMVTIRLPNFQHSMPHKRNLKKQQLLAQVELFSLSLVFQLLLLLLLLVVSITKEEELKMLKVVRLMTESFTRAKLPQLTLTRRHKKLPSLTLMYEQDELNFNYF